MIKEIIKMMLTPPHTSQTTSAIRMEDNKTIEKDTATKLRQRKMTFLPVDVPRIQDNIRMFQMLSRGGRSTLEGGAVRNIMFSCVEMLSTKVWAV